MSMTRRRRWTCSAALDRIAQIEQLPAEPGKGRKPGHGARKVEDRSRRHVAVLGGDGPVDRGEAAGLRFAPDGGKQPCLADSGLAGEQQELAPAGGNVVETPVRELEQVVTPDEERTTDGPERGVHGSEV